VSDKHTFTFWKENFSASTKSVSIGDFSTAFVKRFQSGADGYPKYPAPILYRIVDHFIARKDDLTEATEVLADDLVRFVTRFGSLPNAVQLVAETFLDEHGEVHKWYHFSISSLVLDRKLMTESRDAWLLRDSGTQPGNFVLVLRKAPLSKEKEKELEQLAGTNVRASAKKEILIEHVYDKASGKVRYGCRTTEDEGAASPHGGGGGAAHGHHSEIKFFPNLIAFLQDRTQKHQKFFPICSQLYLGTHSEFSAMDQKDNADKTASDKEKETSSTSAPDDFTCYHMKEDTEITTLTYSAWSLLRAERYKAATNRYKNWQAAFQQQQAAAAAAGKSTQPTSGLGRYVQGLDIFQGSS